MSPDGQILWQRGDGVATALIDRPARRNALNASLCDDLRAHLEDSRDLRAVVIGGSGTKAFCAGADLARRAEDTSGGLTHGGGDSFRPAFSLSSPSRQVGGPVDSVVRLRQRRVESPPHGERNKKSREVVRRRGAKARRGLESFCQPSVCCRNGAAASTASRDSA